MSTRLAVLCSGGGSNLQAILDYLAAQPQPRPIEVALVASDKAGAGALTRAQKSGIPCTVLDRDARTTGLLELLRLHRIDLVVLAGYLRFIPDEVTNTFRGRIINVHPALLPAFGGPGMYGHHVHEAVIRAGVRVTGVTVHFVDAVYDHGPIIAQWPVPVRWDDSCETLAQRVLEAEHALYPRIVVDVAMGDVTLGTDGRVRCTVPHAPPPHFALSQIPGIAAVPVPAEDVRRP